ncbi:DUF397 domain-containing protein [Actinorugispora endophytica]|uniref:Uncharacterized protein DUF397 n=1 Tax=Actinorugispora endophytica TaxID=1605990 RepID=A0A4R6UHI1_9ACTN|nr:DUF397 domain-containing protein [Actinorugispora endophytica]TDQ46321.1 uncharacterized protein DUF397 [Actinorugispora endophytica]
MPETPPLVFRKSSYSGSTTQNCVEVADTSRAVAVRDSQNTGNGHLVFGTTAWREFLAEVKADLV